MDTAGVEDRAVLHIRRVEPQGVPQVGDEISVAAVQQMALQRRLGIPNGLGHLGGRPVGFRRFLLLSAAGGQKEQAEHI